MEGLAGWRFTLGSWSFWGKATHFLNHFQKHLKVDGGQQLRLNPGLQNQGRHRRWPVLASSLHCGSNEFLILLGEAWF